ncbi:hypothetical protein ACFL2V_17080 [Pseudomonadota bacterium]
MIIGTSSIWLQQFKDPDERFIQCITNVWPRVLNKINCYSLEDDITRLLVDLLQKDRATINVGLLTCQWKLREETSDEEFSTKGILDMALILGQDHERYIAYECKRLNVVSKDGKRSSLAGDYVDKGLMRYVKEQYAEALPFGCMIGYVMDGDTEFSIKQLKAAIEKRKDTLNLAATTFKAIPGFFTQFETDHIRVKTNSPISVKHRLFSLHE